VEDDNAYAQLTVTGSDGAVLHDLTYGNYSDGLSDVGVGCFNGDCGYSVETIRIDDPDGFCVTIESRSIIASARVFGCQPPDVTWSDLISNNGVTINGWYQRGGDGEPDGDPGSACTSDDDCNQSTGVVSQPTDNSPTGGPSSWDGACCVGDPGWCRAHSSPGTSTHCYEMDSSFNGVTATTCQY